MEASSSSSPRRITVKVGSNVLTRADGSLDVTRVSSLVDQIAEIRARGVEVILVTSGAVASGRSELGSSAATAAAAAGLDAVDQRQVFSAVGQAKLINRYYEFFREHHLPVGQILTAKETLGTRRHYLNLRTCMTGMLRCGVIPIVNENDAVSLTELMFTDNDELSALVSSMMRVQALVVLSNIDGVYTGKPGEPGVELIREVEPGGDLSRYIRSEKSGYGRGGMVSKHRVARRTAQRGISVMIANGKREGILPALLFAPETVPFTHFLPQDPPEPAALTWVDEAEGSARGRLFLRAEAVRRLYESGAEGVALPSSFSRIEGSFEKDDLVRLMSPDGEELGLGCALCRSDRAWELLMGGGQEPLISSRYLYLE